MKGNDMKSDVKGDVTLCYIYLYIQSIVPTSHGESNERCYKVALWQVYDPCFGIFFFKDCMSSARLPTL